VISEARQLRADGLISHVYASVVFAAADVRDFLGANTPAYAAWLVAGWPVDDAIDARSNTLIPLAARLVIVAEAWSELTASGGPELSHEQALLLLREGREWRCDPNVVAAAEMVVGRERRLTKAPACQPRLHRLPRLVGRAATPQAARH
jgi:hypothetical protein